MLKSKFASQKLFLPFSFLIGLMFAALMVPIQIGQWDALTENQSTIGIFTLDQVFQLASIAIFAVLIFLLRDVPFKTLFKATIALIALAMLGCAYFCPGSHIAYFLSKFFYAKLFLLLAWGYVNQVTNKTEGIKYYFGLSAVSALIGLALYALPHALLLLASRYAETSPTAHSLILMWFAVAYLVLTWVCDRFIHARVHENEEAETSAIVQNEWVPAICLGMIACGMNVVSLINMPVFMAQMKELQLTSEGYSSYMGFYSLGLGLATLVFAVLSIFLGPKIIEKKGWKFAALIAPVLGLIAFLLSLVKPSLWTLLPSQLIPGITGFSWTFPLVQIALLSYEKKTRFALQAWIFLVVAALIEFAVRFANFSPSAVPVVCCVIFVLMIGSTYALPKPK